MRHILTCIDQISSPRQTIIIIIIIITRLFVCNKVDVLHVGLTELHAAHQNLPCYLLTY